MITLQRSEVRIGDVLFYDVFPISENSIIGIGPFITDDVPEIVITDKKSGISSTDFQIIKDRHRRTLIVSFSFPDDIFFYNENIFHITLSNGIDFVECQVFYENLEPSSASLSTLTIEDPEYTLKWIEYNSEVIGIERFYIYSNNKEIFGRFNDSAIHSKSSSKIVSILWDVPYRFPGDAISGQTTQQNHSIYKFRSDIIIGFFDIDEYIIPKSGNILEIAKDIIDDTFVINQDNAHRINAAAVSLQCLIFGCGANKAVNAKSFLRRMNKCAENFEKKWERQKCFVSPQKVNVFAVHMVVDGGTTICLSQKISYFNHYYYLGKNINECRCDIHCNEENSEILNYISL